MLFRSKFLGFSIKGGMVSLSSSRIKTFQHEIERRTIRCRDTTLAKAVDAVMEPSLYIGRCKEQVERLLAEYAPLLTDAQTADGAISL